MTIPASSVAFIRYHTWLL